MCFNILNEIDKKYLTTDQDLIQGGYPVHFLYGIRKKTFHPDKIFYFTVAVLSTLVEQ